MTTMATLRRFAGRMKCRLIDELPYARKVRQMPAVRKACRESLQDLPPVPIRGERRFEIHMLCGHRDADMGVWASWSMMRFLDGGGYLYVHSDGSLTAQDEALWKEAVPAMEVISRSHADAEVEKRLAGTRHLIPWRAGYKTSPQLIDAHLFGEAPVRLIMDSDVLVFRKPEQLIDALGRPVFTWCRDVRDAYSASPELFQEVLGIRLPQRFNCGMLGTPHLQQEDFLQLDELLERIRVDGRIDLFRYWACQTYYALLSTFVEGSAVLPSEYDTIPGKTPGECVLRHFVGVANTRYRYFEEGIPRLLQQAREGSASPTLP